MTRRNAIARTVATVAVSVFLLSACTDDDGADVRNIGDDGGSISSSSSGSGSGSGSSSGSSSAPAE